MGSVIVSSGVKMEMEEVEGDVTLDELYDCIDNTQYSQAFRISQIKAAAKLERRGWGAIGSLHKLIKGSDSKLSEAAKAALERIDPGMPVLNGKETFTVKTSAHVSVEKSLEVKKVIIDDLNSEELVDNARIYCSCHFCKKYSLFSKNVQKFNKLLTKDKFYCSFCLRNEYYREKKNKNILIMSMRGIIGYYYYSFYKAASSSMYLPDINGYINAHWAIGITNPLFKYDNDTYCWFIDFTKIGNKKHQAPVESVLQTVSGMLAAFSLYEHVKESSPATLFQRYKAAILDFHHHRRRPIGQKILAPTLLGCGIPHDYNNAKAIPVNLLKDFVPSHLMETNYKRGKNYNY